MGAAMFTSDASAMQGVMFQMFAHGINVLGLWITADVIEKQTGTRKFSELGGLAQRSPTFPGALHPPMRSRPGATPTGDATELPSNI